MPYQGKLLIGLTGNIACGKSTVVRQLASLGAHTIDADSLIHTILKKGGPAYQPVVDEFGPSILAPDGEIDRRALGRIVFADPEKLRTLEQIEHPIVRQVINARIAGASEPVVVLDAIKLIEVGWADKSDAVWVVTCTREQQLERLMRTRGYSQQEAETRIDAQSPQEEKIARADVVIYNSGTKEQTGQQVIAAWEAFIASSRFQVPGSN
jgi:dephospho-CoA kinase